MTRPSNYEFNVDRSCSGNWAREIVPLFLEMTGKVESALDLGGGHGQWLEVFKASGVRRVLCIDHPCMLEGCVLAPSEFCSATLDKIFPTPSYHDIALSIEFAEHISKESADHIVDFLTKSAPCVLFSAATPFQLGVNHINGQWPTFWHRKFQARGYRVCDCIRHRILHSKTIPYWLKTNLFVYVAEDKIAEYPHLVEFQNPFPLDIQLVHDSALPTAHPLSVYSTSALVKTAVTRVLGLPYRMAKRALTQR